MARTGLYPSEVKRARDELVARGVYPSVDAIRIELGNTGSKSTIHRFLKELQEEEGGAKPPPPIQETLQGLVAQLADELHREADEKAATAAERCAEKEARFRDAELALTRELEESKKRVQDLEARLAAEVHSHAITREVLQEHAAARRTAEQRVLDLQDRLAENDAHLQSLEDKHSHARQALEHYRQASSETRQQDQRRHEHQVQQLQADLRQSQQTIAVRQADITRLNQEGATLVAELSHAKMAAYNAERLLNQQETKLEQIPVLEQFLQRLQEQLAEKDACMLSTRAQLESSRADGEMLNKQVRELELELARASATVDAQQALAAELRMLVTAQRADPLRAS